MSRERVEILGLGAGPANLALAVALEEMAPDLAEQTLLVEQHDDVAWQRGMLLPWTTSQVSFVKDLVTLRNPRSEFSFLNYLHDRGRLDDFVNLGTFTPFRAEISDYLNWVARTLRKTHLQFGRQCVGVHPGTGPDGTVDHWVARFADGQEIEAGTVVIGMGRDARIPAELAQVSLDRMIHSTEFAGRLPALDELDPRRLVVIGSAQSAGEMTWAAHQRYPKASVTMMMRSIGLNAYEHSKFTNELFYPSFVDEFHAARPDAREQLLREMHRTNYSGLAPDMIESLYRELYLDRLNGADRLRFLTMADLTDAAMDGEEIVLRLADRRTRESSELRCDAVLLGTGFVPGMPRAIRDLAAALGIEGITVSRSYRMNTPPNVTAGCYLQGVNEASHGIADSLLSVLAIRSAEVVADLLAERGRAAEPHLNGTARPVPAATLAG
jgi:L-ornithine N5-oxygenase